MIDGVFNDDDDNDDDTTVDDTGEDSVDDTDEGTDETEEDTSLFGMQHDDTTTSVSLSAEDIAALAASDTEDLTYYDGNGFTYFIEADAAGDGYLHLVSTTTTTTELAEDGSTIETAYDVAVLVLSDSEEVPDSSQITFGEDGEIIADGVDIISAAYQGSTEYVDGSFSDFDEALVWASAEDYALTSLYGEDGNVAFITGSEDDIGLPISEDGTSATIELTAEDLTQYDTTEVPRGDSIGHHINDSSDLDEYLSTGVETINIDIPEGFDVVEVNATHNDDPDSGYYVERTYYVLVEEGTTLDPDALTVYDFIENGPLGDEGADQLGIDGDYGFILGVTTGTTSVDFEDNNSVTTTDTGYDVALTGNVTAPSQTIDLTITV